MIGNMERAELSAHAHQAGIHVLFLSPLSAMFMAAGITAKIPSLAAGGAVWLAGQLLLGLALLATTARGARVAAGVALATAAGLVAVAALAPGPSIFLGIPALLIAIGTVPLGRLARALEREPIPRAMVR